MRRYNYNLSAYNDFSMQIEEASITDHGTTLIGCIHSGTVSVGDHIILSTAKDPHLQIDLYVSDISFLNESVNQAEINDRISLSVSGVSQKNVQGYFPLGVYVYKSQGNQLILSKLEKLELHVKGDLEDCTDDSGFYSSYLLWYQGSGKRMAIRYKDILNNLYGIGILTSDILSCSSIDEIIDMVVYNPGVSSNSNRGFETEEDRRKAWERENLETVNQEVQYLEENEEKDEEDEFYKRLNQLLDNWEEWVQNSSTIENFLSELETLFVNSNNEGIRSEYRFLQALCCFYFVEAHDFEKTNFSIKGEQFIDEAIELGDDVEYDVFKQIYRSINIDFNASDLLVQQKELTKASPDILQIEDTSNWYCEDAVFYYQETRLNSLLSSYDYLENNGALQGAAECLEMITQLTDEDCRIIGFSSLVSFYVDYCDEFENSHEKCFLYSKSAVELKDYTDDFDVDDEACQCWLKCLSQLAYCYLKGIGVNKDYQKGMQYALKAASLGDADAMYELGEIYELGKGVEVNSQEALQWYQKAADLGYEDAIQKLSVSSSNNTASDILDLKSSEQEYLETIKTIYEEDSEISSRERRLLDCLRTKLGISEERAQELEDSLKRPQLTADEQEYLDEYRALLDGGNSISDKERRLLEKVRTMLCISERRARELENL